MSKLSIPLPANLPENWTYGQIIAPTGQEVDLPANYGYNYLMNQVNNSQKAALELDSKKAELDMSNLDSPSAALYNLGAGVRPNLVDNWDFTNPVNQREKTQYSGEMSLDRWGIESGSSLTLKDGYITIATSNTALIQRIPESEADKFIGKTVTVSILTQEGNLATQTAVVTYDKVHNFSFGTSRVDGVACAISFYPTDKSFQISRISGTGNVKAVKTELGDTQTLAYQKPDGKWELLEHADYSAQLSKCQQYFWRSPVYALWTSMMYTNYVPVNISFPMEMRVKPTVTVFSYSGTKGILSRWGEVDDTTVTATPNTGSVGTKGINALTMKNYNTNQAYSYYIEASADV